MNHRYNKIKSNEFIKCMQSHAVKVNGMKIYQYYYFVVKRFWTIFPVYFSASNFFFVFHTTDTLQNLKIYNK